MPQAYLILVRLVINDPHLNDHQCEELTFCRLVTEHFFWFYFFWTFFWTVWIFPWGKGEKGVMFYGIIEMLVRRDSYRLSGATCCCRISYWADQTWLCLSMTWKIFMDGHCHLTCSSKKVFPEVQYKTMKPSLLSFVVCLTLLRRVWLWFPCECPLKHDRML